jgi:hypothetical protein
MTKENNCEEKKKWSAPVLQNLSIRETLGGATIFTGEDSYADPNPESGL